MTTLRNTLLAALGTLVMASALPAAEPLIKLDVRGKTLEGMPLAVSEKEVLFLARDGQLAEFPPDVVTNYSRVGNFRSYSQAEIRGALLHEFGQGYEVSGVGHYIVVHPAGKRDQWAPRFEELYRSFIHYFAARGWQLSEPRFPLVAVVYPRQADFWQQAQQEGVRTSNGLLGYYSPITNRILMFDATAGAGFDWTQNSDTIIHEAAHQTAFNTGVHTRFGDAPRWIVEGLGTMFEARGVWQSRTYPHQTDRINRGRLESWRTYSRSRRPKDAISQLVSSDRIFSADPEGAYAEAWALSFYLMESSPKKYAEFLAKTASRPAFTVYPAPERLSDFSSAFGSDLTMLDARFQRFLAGLK